MASDRMPRRNFRYWRLVAEASFCGLRAARGKGAAGGLGVVPGLTCPRGFKAGERGLYARGGRKQHTGVWVLAVSPKAGGGGLLHQMPGIHDSDTVAEMAGDFQVVGDEKVRH